MKEFDSDEPVTFVTYEFFEHELQTTPVIKGSRSCTNTLSVIGSGLVKYFCFRYMFSYHAWFLIKRLYSKLASSIMH